MVMYCITTESECSWTRVQVRVFEHKRLQSEGIKNDKVRVHKKTKKWARRHINAQEKWRVHENTSFGTRYIQTPFAKMRVYFP